MVLPRLVHTIIPVEELVLKYVFFSKVLYIKTSSSLVPDKVARLLELCTKLRSPDCPLKQTFVRADKPDTFYQALVISKYRYISN